MSDTRCKNYQWRIGPPDDKGCRTYPEINAALLMDIRDELQTLNRLLGCVNFTRIPRVLDTIAVNTRKPKPRKRKGKK